MASILPIQIMANTLDTKIKAITFTDSRNYTVGIDVHNIRQHRLVSVNMD